LEPGEVLECHWSREWQAVNWMTRTDVEAFVRDWGYAMGDEAVDRMDDATPWLGLVHDDGAVLVAV
jgi:hypothetical protein